MRDLIFDPPEVGCVLYLPGLPQSGDKIIDRSPYGHNGTITGAVWRFNGSVWYLDFDGTDDGINCGSGTSLDNLTELTYMCWVNRDVIDDAHIVMTKQSKYLYILSTNYLRGQVNAATTNASSDSNTTIGASAWNRLAMTYSNSGDKKIRLYQNGAELAYTTQTASVGTPTDESAEDLIVGRYKTGGFETDGGITRTKVFNRALTFVEITTSYNQEKHLFGRV